MCSRSVLLLVAVFVPTLVQSFASHIIDVPGLSDLLSPNAVVYYEDDNSEAIDTLVSTRFYTTPFEPRIPTILVLPAIVEDVQVSVRYAYDQSLDFGVVGGGHGVGGLGHTSGLLIDMSGLTAVSVDTAAGLTTYQTGNNIGTVDLASKESGVYSPNGNCPQVGVGAVLHGGYGAMTKTRGLSIDNVVAYQVVTRTGELLSVTAESDSELFWGLRGAASMLGVVTEITIRHFPVDDHYGGSIIFTNVSALPKLVAYVNDNALDQINEFHVRFSVFSAPPPAIIVVEVTLWGNGDAFAALGGKEAVINGLIAAGEVPIAVNTVAANAYYEQQSFLGPIVADAPRGFNEYALNSATTTSFPVAAAQVVADAFAGNVPLGTIFFLHGYGGAFSAVGASDTAYAGRDMKWDFVSQISFPPDVPEAAAAGLSSATDALHRAIEEAVGEQDLSPHGYLNWGMNEAAHIRKAFGDNLERLLELKQALDPTNFFHRTYDLGNVGA
eukprot:2206987-Pleurochrysis_carterae.AAC.2